LPSASPRTLLAAAAACLGLALPGAAAAEWITNSITLDPGLCVRNLQLGSFGTASASATPSFLIQGDGGASAYAIAIDGRSLGTFHSAGDGVVCITTPSRLSEGAHVLTGTELEPHAGSSIQLGFSVDTVPPRAPSRPALAAYADTGARGDNVTTRTSATVTGTAPPNSAVQISRNGGALVAGTRSDARGRWSATTIPLTPGTYLLTAVSMDAAGNRSSPSAALRLTIASATG
jgi:Bacterial Ig-like domain